MLVRIIRLHLARLLARIVQLRMANMLVKAIQFKFKLSRRSLILKLKAIFSLNFRIFSPRLQAMRELPRAFWLHSAIKWGKVPLSIPRFSLKDSGIPATKVISLQPLRFALCMEKIRSEEHTSELQSQFHL